MSTPDPKQMREDASAWTRAKYPAVAVGRYRDAADEIERLRRIMDATQRLTAGGALHANVLRMTDLISRTGSITILDDKGGVFCLMEVVESALSEQADMVAHTSLSQGGVSQLLPGRRSIELSLVLRSVR